MEFDGVKGAKSLITLCTRDDREGKDLLAR